MALMPQETNLIFCCITCTKNGYSCMLCTYWIRLHSKTELMIIWIVIVCVPSLLFIRCFGYTGLVFFNVLLIRCYGHIGLLLSLFHNFSLSLWKIDFTRGDPVDHVSWNYPFLNFFPSLRKLFFSLSIYSFLIFSAIFLI